MAEGGLRDPGETRDHQLPRRVEGSLQSADHGRRDPGDHRQNVTGKEGAGHG